MPSSNTGTTVGLDEDNFEGFEAFLGQLDWDIVEKELETAPEPKNTTAEHTGRQPASLNNRRKRTRSDSTDSTDSNRYGIDWDAWFKRLPRNLNPEDYTPAPQTRGLTAGEMDEYLALMRSSWKEHDH
ncbi:hypothetical protein RUND412_005263 [Rhizina undulata]